MGADQKRKEARKRKFGAQSGPADEDAVKQQTVTKKQKREHESPIETAEPHATDPTSAEHTAAEIPDQHDEQNKPIQSNSDSKPQRFIIFVGNLPISATDASIAKHFAKIRPISIRHRTDKTTGKSKRFAFIEFEAYDRMKTCLKLYHHSSFDDGESPARKLNVELTVGGGGGKSKDRKAKLKEKNVKLNDERWRRAVEEETKKGKETKKEKEKEKAAENPETYAKKLKKQGRVNLVAGMEKADAAAAARAATEQDGDIHPSRRGRMRLV